MHSISEAAVVREADTIDFIVGVCIHCFKILLGGSMVYVKKVVRLHLTIAS